MVMDAHDEGGGMGDERELVGHHYVVITDAVLDVLSMQAAYLYLILSTFVRRDERVVWPSVPTLATRTGWSERTVQVYLRELVTGHVVTIEERRTDRGGPTTNAYILHLEPTPPGAAHFTTLVQPAAPRSISIRSNNPPTPHDEQFEAFWAAYPRKVEKRVAQVAWTTLTRKAGVDPEQLITAAANYARAAEGKDPSFVKHPSTFLRQDRWLDWLKPPVSRADEFKLFNL